MSVMKLTSKYLFNEIPDDEKKINKFGHKACKISLAKKWQFAVPDTVFLSGDLVKEIFEKKHIPAEILSNLKNKLLAIRPSPIVDQFKKNEPFLFIGLEYNFSNYSFQKFYMANNQSQVKIAVKW